MQQALNSFEKEEIIKAKMHFELSRYLLCLEDATKYILSIQTSISYQLYVYQRRREGVAQETYFVLGF